MDQASGSKSLSEFQKINASEAEVSSLREYRLSDEEIALKLKIDLGELKEVSFFLKLILLREKTGIGMKMKVFRRSQTLFTNAPQGLGSESHLTLL